MSYTNLIKKIIPLSIKGDIPIDKQWVFINENYLTDEMKLLNLTNCICGKKIKHITLVFNPLTNIVGSVGGNCLTYFKLLRYSVGVKKTICPYCKKINAKGFHINCLKKSKCVKKLLTILHRTRSRLCKRTIEKKKNIERTVENQKFNNDFLYIHTFKRGIIYPPELLTEEQKLCYKILYTIFQNTKYEYGKILDTQFTESISDLILNKLEVFKKSKQQPISLKGAAGTGKTTVITHLILNAITENDKICVLAPTHKALKNIRNAFSSINTKKLIIQYATISKFLNAKVQYDENGKQFYEISPDTVMPYSHIIIDEMSMINKKDFEAIEDIMKYNPNILFIFLGDDCQLPPIDEIESVTFTKVKNIYELKNIVRAGNDDLRNIYSFFRNKVKTNSRIFLPSTINSMKNVKYITNIDDIKNVLGGRFDFKSDMVLAGCNAKVDAYQNYIRNIYGYTNDEYCISEKMIFKSFMKLPLDINESYYQDFINNLMIGDYNELLKVSSNIVNGNLDICKKFKYFNKVDICFITSAKECEFLGYTVHSIDVSIEDSDKQYNFHKVKSSSMDCFTKDCKIWWNKLKNIIKYNKCPQKNITMLWSIYYIILNLIDAPLIFGYSSTIHKSQGSTYRNIFLDINNCSFFKRNLSTYNKLLYTAVTRTKDMLYILDCNDDLV